MQMSSELAGDYSAGEVTADIVARSSRRGVVTLEILDRFGSKGPPSHVHGGDIAW